ncbi:hypothetical protein EDC96DRAFT_105203 [Choanephora cucurbitarum]|nr:hypothetical protein EDC96DRAFT_105203 [Choanephora cucurbitarum]
MKVGFSLTCRPVRGRVTGEGGSILSRRFTLWSVLADSLWFPWMTLYDLFRLAFRVFVLLFILLFFLIHKQKIQKKTNNEIVNVYLLFCLYISYCFKPLSSVILHQ